MKQILKTEPRWVRNEQLAVYLSCTPMTIYRWQRDRTLGFPQPAIVNERPLTDLNAVDEWLRARVSQRNRGGGRN